MPTAQVLRFRWPEGVTAIRMAVPSLDTVPAGFVGFRTEQVADGVTEFSLAWTEVKQISTVTDDGLPTTVAVNSLRRTLVRIDESVGLFFGFSAASSVRRLIPVLWPEAGVRPRVANVSWPLSPQAVSFLAEALTVREIAAVRVDDLPVRMLPACTVTTRTVAEHELRGLLAGTDGRILSVDFVLETQLGARLEVRERGVISFSSSRIPLSMGLDCLATLVEFIAGQKSGN